MDRFAPLAEKYVTDVDYMELIKLPDGWEKRCVDLSIEEPLFDPQPGDIADRHWLAWARGLYLRFRYELDGANIIEDYADPYYFTRVLSEACGEGEIIVPGSSGMQSCALMQAFKVKRGQKILLCNTIGAMGLEPMAIGAAIATGKRIVCVTGDGGFYLNFQELEVVKRLGLDVKYFVFCNGGYGSISTMQDARFNLRVGADPSSGFTLPDLERVAAVWGFAYHSLRNNADISAHLPAILAAPHASITRVNVSLAFRYATKVQSALVDGKFVNDDMADMTPKINLAEIMTWQ
jgi:acetolactate synthase-1/2/3 large subunit